MNLLQAAKNKVLMREEWLKEACLAKELVEVLPKSIQSTEAIDCDVNCNQLSIALSGGDKTLRELKLDGIGEWKNLYSNYSNQWRAVTKLDVNGIEATVTVYNTSLPEGCHVEETTVTKTIIERQAICNKTGQVI